MQKRKKGKIMKGKKLCIILTVVLVLAGCGKSKEEQYLEKYTDTLANYMRSVNTRVYKSGDSVYLCKSETMCFRYYVEQLPEPIDGAPYYKISKMSFNFDEIKPDTFFTVSYPDKMRIEDITDNSEIIDRLEEKFQEKLTELSLTWEELDDFIIWYAYVESLNFEGTHLFEDDYIEKLPK